MTEDTKPTNSSVEQPHVLRDDVEQVIIVPGHEPRGPGSPEFEKNRSHLIHECGYGCWTCGAKEDLEAHHIFEWSMWPDVDPAKMQAVLKLLDFYGFSAKDSSPISTPDDIRNLLILCSKHHRGKDNGIHTLTFPIWLVLKVLKDGIDITDVSEKITSVQNKDKSLEK